MKPLCCDNLVKFIHKSNAAHKLLCTLLLYKYTEWVHFLTYHIKLLKEISVLKINKEERDIIL